MSRRKTRELYWVDKRTLPWQLLPSLTKEECVRAQNRPLWVCDRMAKELHSIPEADNFTARERLALVYKVEKIGCSIEDPFQGALRLSILCDAIRRDVVGEEIIRNTAFELKNEAVSSKEGVSKDWWVWFVLYQQCALA